MALELRLIRYSSQKIDTLGIFKDEIGEFFSYSIEDEKRDIKISGETRIPEGRYPLKIRKEDTDLTLKHRIAYNKGEITPWFFFHIEICNIPNFKGVYIHVGNTEKDTEGCLLLGDKINNNTLEPGLLSNSTNAIKRFYLRYYPILLKGEKEIYLNIITI